jgi:dihydroorotase
VDASKFRSKGRNTPYAGQTLRGIVELTVVGGRVIHQRGK